MENKRNISIQILRVYACILVFLVHFGQRVNFTGILRTFTDFGRLGVHLFFLISGFLAGKTFFGKSNIRVREYYQKRMIAILPLYYLVIVYYFISENLLNLFVPVIPADELGIGWLRYLFLLNGFLNSDTYFWSNLGITWTIPIFMFFYLIAPVVLRKVNTVSSAVLVWVAVFAVTKTAHMVYPCTILNYLHLLFLGVVLYACASTNYHKHAIVAFLSAAICITILDQTTYAYISLFACLILALTSFDDIRMPDWLRSVINLLDTYAYTLYLMHGVVFCSILDRLNLIGVSRILIAVLAIAGTVLATVFVGKFIEKPIQKWLKSRFIQSVQHS